MYLKNKEKIKEYDKQWYEKNKEKIKDYGKIYYEENKKDILLKNKKYSIKNKKKLSLYFKKYYEKNKQLLKEYTKQWAYKNKEQIGEYDKKYWKENKFKIKKKNKQYYEKNKEHIIKQQIKKDKERYNNDINFRIRDNIRIRIYSALKKNTKSKKTKKLLGCTIEECKQHLEKQFVEGMTWDNHSLHGWHIDHIKPCCSFDLSNPKQQEECFHYTNLQPLWAKENLKKGGRW